MRLVFFGTPEFAVESLKVLLEEGHDIAAVVTAPDKPAGRGQKVQVSAVKQFATERGLIVLQPASLRDESFVETLRTYRHQLQIVVAFRMLPQSVWELPPLGTYNLHASLLPRYRGAAPINRAIMSGEKTTGVTTFKLRHEIDSGSVLLQETVEIGADTEAGQLHDILKIKGARLLARTVAMIEDYERKGEALPFVLQDESKVTHAPKIFREDCRLNWGRTALELHNQVRGLSPFPGAFTTLTDERGAEQQVKIFRTRVLEEVSMRPDNGLLIDAQDGTLTAQCGRGTLQILELQLEGRKRMSAEEFRRGFRGGGRFK